ncbi:MAG: hypothetical protein LBI86_00665 [Treponema sp.]|jgi:hypothetical protein|nr:hypothetical protein [Treponema sp.]
MTSVYGGRPADGTYRRKETAWNALVVLVCLAGALFSFGMFWRDLYRGMDHLAEPMGTITYKRQAAQRRFTDRVLWIRLAKGAPVYQGDFIHTAEFSEASIHFGEGPDIKLAENTLIQIHNENGENVVDFSQGDLSIALDAGAGPLAIRVLVSGENRVKLDAGAVVSASVDETGAFAMQVLEGTVTANGETLTSGESLPAALGEVRAAPLSPRPDTYFFAPDGKADIRFTWSRVNYSNLSRFELAMDRRFRSDRTEKILLVPEESISVSLDPGTYWWRVYPDGGEPPRAPAGKIVVLPPVTPSLISPAEGYVFYRDQADPRLFWKSGRRPANIQDSGEYLLEVADNSRFERPRLSVHVEGTEGASLVYNPGEGAWYWRVRQVFPDVELPFAWSYFSIVSGEAGGESSGENIPSGLNAAPAGPAAPTGAPEMAAGRAPAASRTAEPARQPPAPPPSGQARPEPLPSPSGMHPPDRFVVGPGEIKRSRRLEFGWNAVPGANSYIFTLLKENDTSPNRGTSGFRTIIDAETRRTAYTVEDIALLERGSFIWRVEAVYRSGGGIERRGKPEESRFTVNVPAVGNPRIRVPGVLYGQ